MSGRKAVPDVEEHLKRLVEFGEVREWERVGREELGLGEEQAVWVWSPVGGRGDGGGDGSGFN